MAFGRETQGSIPGHETATFRSADGATTHALTQAIRYPMTTRELAASYGVYRASDVIWTLGEADLAGNVPVPRCRIENPVGGGGPFTILEVSHGRLARFYKCVTRNIELAENLRDRINIYTPRIASETDDAGNREPSFKPLRLKVAARVQLVSATPTEAMGRRFTEQRFTIFLGEQIDGLTGEDQIRHNGRVYQIESVADPERIDVLQRVEVVWRGETEAVA